MSGKIILQPMGGLANRMRVVSVLYELCQNAGADFEVLWTNNRDLGAAWENLFMSPQFTVIDVSGSYIHAHRSKKWYRRLPHQLWMFVHDYTWMSYEDVYALTKIDTVENSALIRADWYQRLINGEKIFITTGDNLGPVNNLSMFSPIKEISEEVIANIDKLFNGHKAIYGLHIRRTDNIWSIEDSPLCLFEKKITEILTQQSDSAFFLASDDSGTISYLKDKFGDKIIIRDRELSRSTVSGMQDALIDMLLLGKTNKIFGSYFSSFSEMAAWFGGVDLEIIKKIAKK